MAIASRGCDERSRQGGPDDSQRKVDFLEEVQHAMQMRPRRNWQFRDFAQLALLLGVGLWLNRQPLADIIAIGRHDGEQSHIFLAPIVAGYLLWLRRSRLRYVMVQPSLVGLAIAA